MWKRGIGIIYLGLLICGALFSEPLVLHLFKHQSTRFLKKNLGMELVSDAWLLQQGKITISHGELLKRGAFEASFSKLYFTPSFLWKRRKLGGELLLKEVEVSYQKSASTPTWKVPGWLELQTHIQGGTLSLDGTLFGIEVDHLISAGEIEGVVALSAPLGDPPLLTYFHQNREQNVDLKTELHAHRVDAIYSLLTYFFGKDLPDLMRGWEPKTGRLKGSLAITLKGNSLGMARGKLEISSVEAKNLDLEIQGELDRLFAEFDINLESVETMEGLFSIEGGRLSFEEGVWDLTDLNTHICIEAGRVLHSRFEGSLMGIKGELFLDWSSPELLMELELAADSHQLESWVPRRFLQVFPDDHFVLNASLSRLGEELDLVGEVEVNFNERLEFGCHFDPLLVSTKETFLGKILEQFGWGHQRSGWVRGVCFPLEQYLSPAFFPGLTLQLAGELSFEGTFDNEELTLYYASPSLQLESPHFLLKASNIEKGIHTIDLKTQKHWGELPLKATEFFHKRHQFHLTEGSGIAHIEGQNISIEGVTIYSDALCMQGAVELEVQAFDDIDLSLHANSLAGPLEDAVAFLSHFKPAIFSALPLRGELFSEGRVFDFHYHFSPRPKLLSGEFFAELQAELHTPFFSIHIERSALEYDWAANTLSFAGSTGRLEMGAGLGSIAFELPTLAFSNFSELEVALAIETPFFAAQGSMEKGDFSLKGEGVEVFATQIGKTLHIANCGYGPYCAGGMVSWDDHSISIDSLELRGENQGEVTIAGHFDRSKREFFGEIQSVDWQLSRLESKWKPQGRVKGQGALNWSRSKGLEATIEAGVEALSLAGIQFGTSEHLSGSYTREGGLVIEGLKAATPSGELYQLGSFNYHIGSKKVFFQGLDFSLPAEKIPWAADLASTLFPGFVHSALHELALEVKQKEPLEGCLSIEMHPDNLWIYLRLRDGRYYLWDRPLDLKNFLLVYDPQQLEVQTECNINERECHIHLTADALSLREGALELSSGGERVKALWMRDPREGWGVKEIEGNLCGIDIALKQMGSHPEDWIALTGEIAVDPTQAHKLLSETFLNLAEKWEIEGQFLLQGDFRFSQANPKVVAFEGGLFADSPKVHGVKFESLSSYLWFTPDEFLVSDLTLADWAGDLHIDRVAAQLSSKGWEVELDQLKVSDFRLSRLKSPWTDWKGKRRPFYQSFFVKTLLLERLVGRVGDWTSFQGQGVLNFTNPPKTTLLSNLLMIPSEITARIGLDLTNFIPSRGEIDYEISEGKIWLNEFRNMFSDGKRSRFYLAEGHSASIDFEGNLDFRVKMKQYNLLMKLAEFFTITVNGTCSHPTYTFSNHFDETYK